MDHEELKRFECDQEYGVMAPHATGGWVHYGDYEAIQARIDKALAVFDEWDEPGLVITDILNAKAVAILKGEQA